MVILGPKWPNLAQNSLPAQFMFCLFAMATHSYQWNSHIFDPYPIARYNSLLFYIITDMWT